MRLQSEEIQVHAAEMTKLRNEIENEKRRSFNLEITVSSLNKTLNENALLDLLGSGGSIPNERLKQEEEKEGIGRYIFTEL